MEKPWAFGYIVRMKKFVVLFSILVSFFALSGCVTTSEQSDSDKPDLVLKVELKEFKPFTGSETLDAIDVEATKSLITTDIAVLVIEDTLRGEPLTRKRGGASEVQQLKNAYKNQNLWKMLTLDTQDPDEEIPVKWFYVGLSNLFDTFQVSSPEDAVGKTYRAEFKKDPETGAYVLTAIRPY